jgi:hypothetical protein
MREKIYGCIGTVIETCRTYNPTQYKRGIELLPVRWAKVVENNDDYIVD